MRQRQESKVMKDENENQNEAGTSLFTKKGEGNYEYKGDFFEDPVHNAVNGVLYAKERNPRYWNYSLSIKGAKKLIAFCCKYVETRRHGREEIKELLETKLSGMYPYCSFADFSRLSNLQTTDDIKKSIRVSKASEELSEYAHEFEEVLIMAEDLLKDWEG